MTRLHLHPPTVALCALAIAALVAASIWDIQDRILYNPSHSIPQGLYLRTQGPIVQGAIVTVRAVTASPRYASARAFTDAGDRFIKHVAATRGQIVCADASGVFIDGELAAQRAEFDAAGRRLPTWSGCRTLSAEEILLLGDTPDSFDGRYWGPISLSLVEGVWRPFPR